MSNVIYAADLFCGAGGTSYGLVQAMESLGYSVQLTAINHWPVAIASHLANHPGTRHLCTGVDAINPRDLYLEGQLDILWASPECTHHSVARGGRPMNDQSRSTAWSQGFPRGYIFTGTKTDQVKQIGNAVPAGLSRAIVLAVMTQNPKVAPQEETVAA